MSKRLAITYRIVRMYRDDKPSFVLRRGLTAAEAREHCRDPETSSSTCTQRENLDHTEQYGQWFDGYEAELS